MRLITLLAAVCAACTSSNAHVNELAALRWRYCDGGAVVERIAIPDLGLRISVVRCPVAEMVEGSNVMALHAFVECVGREALEVEAAQATRRESIRIREVLVNTIEEWAYRTSVDPAERRDWLDVLASEGVVYGMSTVDMDA